MGGDIIYIHTVHDGSVLPRFCDGFIYEKLLVISFLEPWRPNTLENAYHTQNPADGLIFHSDLALSIA